MADIQRSAEAVWNGELKNGSGTISSASGVLKKTPYSFKTRFEQEQGTNPEELIAAAHAGCYSMALANTLSGKGHEPESVKTTATCSLTPQQSKGFKITKMQLDVSVQVKGLDDAQFQEIAREAEAGCPVSNVLRDGLQIELNASLE